MSIICSPEYKRLASHPSSDLRYRLVNGRISLAPMIVLASRTISWGEWSVSFYVLGASHAMCLRRGHRQITEILSCASPPAYRQMIAEFEIGNGIASTIALRDISVSFQIKTQLLSEIEPFGCRQGDNSYNDCLEHAYPNPDLDVPSWTRLRWKTTSNCLHLETEHTYPHEGVSIYSETTILRLVV